MFHNRIAKNATNVHDEALRLVYKNGKFYKSLKKMSLCPQTEEILTYHPLKLLISLKDSSTYVSPTVIYRGGNQSVYFGEENMLSLALKIWDLISHAESLKYFKEKIKFGKRQRLCNPYTGQTDFV